MGMKVTPRRFVASLLVLTLYLQAVALVPVPAAAATSPAARAVTPTVPTAPEPQTIETVVVFGPKRFDRTGPVSRFSEQFELPAGLVAPFTVQVSNGNPDGTHRVLSAILRLNGVVLNDAGQVSTSIPSLTLPVQLTSSNTLDVSFFGRYGSFIAVTVTASRVTASNAPVISNFNPKQGPTGTQVTLTGTSLKLGDTVPGVTFAGGGNMRKPAQVLSSTATEVLVTVPNGAVNGPIELTTANGSARTASDFTVQPSQDFQVNVMPATVSAVQRGTATQVVTLTSPQADFSQLAGLVAAGLPAGVVAKFEPEQITAGANSTLTLNLNNVNLSPGSYAFTVRATATVDGQELQRTSGATLNVVAAGQTSLTGLVLNNEKEPIIGATVSLDGKSSTTDSAGVFLLVGVTAGTSRPVMIDGRTASAPNKTYPVIVEPATVVAGQVNTVPFTFYLPALDTQFEKDLVPNQTNVVGNPRLPDLAMTIPANAGLRNLDGTPVTRVSISPVEPDRVPAPLPSNLGANMVYTSQPGGAEPAAGMVVPVVYPNLAGADPNTRVELYYFDHDAVVWKRYGFGRVSADGRTIAPETDPATGKPYGLPDFSWHFPVIPPNVTQGGNPADPDCGNRGGNPVDYSTGIKIENTTDVTFGGARGSLELTRVYTTDLGISCASCPFGRGTTHNYDIRLTGTFDVGGTGRVKLPEQVTGRLFNYNAVLSAARGVAVFTSTATTSQLGDEVRRLGNGTFEYRQRDGSSMKFDSNGRLTSTTDTNGNTVTLTYTGNNLTRVTDAVGRSLDFTYDSSGRVTRVTDPLGRNWNYTYTSGLLTQVKDPLQSVTTYAYNAATTLGRLTSIVDKRGRAVKQIAYDGFGRVSEQKFADRGVERYSYTTSGNEVTGVTITDALGRVQTKRMNVAGYVTESTDALGQKTRITRDLNTNLTTTLSGPCGCAEGLYEYDERGNMTKQSDRLGGVRRMEYEPVFNRLTKLTDELGRITLYAYDSRGNLTTRTDALGRVTTYAYDGFGQLTSVTDPLGHARSFEYDAQGNLTAAVDALNNRITFEYDAVGRMTATVDALGRRSTFVYDALDRVTHMTDTAGAATTLEYDPNGNLTGFVNALGQRWTGAFDSKDRLVSTKDPLGRVARWVYDKEDQLITRVSPTGRTTNYEYDPRGLLEEMTSPLGFITRYKYDNRKNLTTLTDARGNVTTFTYDELYRLSSRRDPLGQLTSYKYDAAGNLTESTDRLGRRTAYAYDALDRPTQVRYADATVDYTYDPARRLTRINDTQSGSMAWAYDNADRLLSETTPQGVVSYTYNAANQRASMRAADRALVEYGYDAAGRLQTIKQGAETFTYAYDTLSRVSSLLRPNGVRTTYAYDNVYRLARLTHANALNQAFEDFQYAYNDDDEIENITSLASAHLLPTAKTAATADAANRIQQFGTSTYTHDNEGQTTSRTDAPTVSNYNWDARGRLTRVSLSNGQQVDYAYDALNRRTGRTHGGATTSFLYDGANVVLDQEAGGATTEYLNGQAVDNKLALTSSSGGKNYFLQDHLNSTVALTDVAGNVSERLSYGAFGDSTGSGITRYDYTGRERDPVSGMIYYRARWMDPKQGRFISEDPIGSRGGNNLYVYALNSPVNRIDPSGNASLLQYIGAAYRAVAVALSILAQIHNNSIPPTLPPEQTEVRPPPESEIPEPEVPEYPEKREPEDKPGRRRKPCPTKEPEGKKDPKKQPAPEPEPPQPDELTNTQMIVIGALVIIVVAGVVVAVIGSGGSAGAAALAGASAL